MSDDQHKPADEPSCLSMGDKIWALVKDNQESLQKLRESFKDFEQRQKEFQDKKEAEYESVLEKMQTRQNEIYKLLTLPHRPLEDIEDPFYSPAEELIDFLHKGKLVELLEGQNIHIDMVSKRTEGTYEDKNGELQRKDFDMSAESSSEFILINIATTLETYSVDYFLRDIKEVKKYFGSSAKKKTYGALAYLISESDAHVYAEKEGLFVIKVEGDKAQIINQPGFKPKNFSGIKEDNKA